MKTEKQTLDSVTSPERLGALRATGLLDTRPEESFDRLTRLASKFVGAPTALVSLVDEDRQFFKSSVGLREDLEKSRETPLSHSYCKYVVATESPLAIEDARKNEMTRDSPAIPDFDAISYCGIPLRDARGHVLGSLCVVDSEPHSWSEEDVATLSELAELVMTELRLRRLANDLDHSNEALKEANQSLRDFISVASHDMKNPLTSVLGFSSIMTQRWESFPDDQKKGFVEIIERQAQFLARLVDDLLTLSKVEAGALSPQPIAVEVASAIEAIGRHDVAADFEPQMDAGISALVDPDHFRRIMTNLMTNAVKYGEPPFVVRGEVYGGLVRLSVIDHGEGVPAEFVSRLFQKFARAEERVASREGTGLGLSIVRGLAEINGGSVHYETNEPRGSRFVVTLPLTLEST